MIKGWPSVFKTLGSFFYPTIQPIGINRAGMDVQCSMGVYLVNADSVDSISGQIITAAAHNAKVGDTIRFSSGLASAIECRVLETTTNTITVTDDFSRGPLASYAPVAADTFDILRVRTAVIGSDGSLVTAPISSGPVQFTRDAATQTVTEDTAAIANNRSLPVKTINDVYATLYNDYSSTNVTTGAWVELTAATTQKTIKMHIFDSSGSLLELGTGAAGLEARKLLITPGGPGHIEVQIASGTRLSVRAVDTDATTGLLAINLSRE